MACARRSPLRYWNRCSPSRPRHRCTSSAMWTSSTVTSWAMPPLPTNLSSTLSPLTRAWRRPERRQAERAVGLDVLLVADADHRALEQEHHTGGDRGQAQVATRRGRARDVDESPAARRRTPARVSNFWRSRRRASSRGSGTAYGPCVATRRLDVAVGRRADPHVGPRRRDRKGTDAFEDDGVADDRASAVRYENPRPARTRRMPSPSSVTRCIRPMSAEMYPPTIACMHPFSNGVCTV